MIDRPPTPYASSRRSYTRPYGDLIDSSETSSEYSFTWIQESGKKPIFGSGQSIRDFQEEGKYVPRPASKLGSAFAPRSPADSFHRGMDTSAGKPCSEWHAEWQAAERERLISLQALRNFDTSLDLSKETPNSQTATTTKAASRATTKSQGRHVLGDRTTNSFRRHRPEERVTSQLTERRQRARGVEALLALEWPPRKEAETVTAVQKSKAKAPVTKAKAPVTKAKAPGIKAKAPGIKDKAPVIKDKAPFTNAEAPATKGVVPKPQLSDWQVCYEINLAFQKKIVGPWECVACKTTGTTAHPQIRSNFVTVVATCPDGHKDHFSSAKASSTQIACGKCDEDFALRVSQQTVKCFNPDCRRMLVVDWELVRLARTGDEWQEIVGLYLQLLNKNPKFNCVICQETLPSAEGPGRTPTRKCNHKVNVCSVCLCNMVTHAVKTGNFEEIKCPAAATDQCKGVLDGKDVEAFVDRETYKEYDKKMMEKLLKDDPRYRWCNRKTRYGVCDWGQFCYQGDDNTRWECKKCKASNCFTCKALWHEGLTCMQIKLKRENDPASLRLLQQTTKKCPGCGHRIEKNRFCKDMICQRSVGGCGIEFCWACKIIYKPIKAHLSKCPQRPRDSPIVPKPKMPNNMYRHDWDNDPGYIERPDEYDMTGFGQQ